MIEDAGVRWIDRGGVITFYCLAEGCRWPFLRLVNGQIVVMSTHFGTRHSNAVDADLVARLAAIQRQGGDRGVRD